MTAALFATSVQGGESDERYTPAWVFDGLGLEFGTDPASPGAGDHVPARQKWTRIEDGLAHQWEGRVWLNPPFSNATPWARRFMGHGHGVFLGPVSNARWFIDLIASTGIVWHVRDFAFTHPLHAGKRSNMPVFFTALGSDCVAALERLATSGRHDGVLLRQYHPTPQDTDGDAA